MPWSSGDLSRSSHEDDRGEDGDHDNAFCTTIPVFVVLSQASQASLKPRPFDISTTERVKIEAVAIATIVTILSRLGRRTRRGRNAVPVMI
jgi:hypothetical protein